MDCTIGKNLMMNIILLCIAALLTQRQLQASEAQALFIQANQNYAEQHYQKALELYQMIEHKGAAAWHNMGNCACRLKQPVEALVYWRKAQRGCDFSHYEELQKNIDGIYGQMGKQSPRSTGRKFVDKVVGRFSALWYQVAFLLFWALLLVLLWWKKRYRKGVFFLVLPITMLLGAIVIEKYRSHNMTCALVVQPSAPLFAGPDAHYQQVGAIALADEVHVVDARGDWCKVEAGGLAGWILADTIKKL